MLCFFCVEALDGEGEVNFLVSDLSATLGVWRFSESLQFRHRKPHGSHEAPPTTSAFQITRSLSLIRWNLKAGRLCPCRTICALLQALSC